jgi:hypothetical protein
MCAPLLQNDGRSSELSSFHYAIVLVATGSEIGRVAGIAHGEDGTGLEFTALLHAKPQPSSPSSIVGR